MIHPLQDELSAWISGRLDESRANEISEHVDTCDTCEQTVVTLESDTSGFLSSVRSADYRSVATLKSQTSENRAIGQYNLVNKLGEGGMGAVYRAVHLKLDKEVALKVLTSGRMRNQTLVDRFEREMKAVGKLDHPNIVRAMDAGEIDGTHFLVMELVDGADLTTVLKKNGPLSVANACELIRQAAVGLDEAHHHGMVHRDIKPSNLMLARSRLGQPTLKILDLGLALLASGDGDGPELTSTGQLMGTIDFMSPEQCDDSHNVDIRADIYSLGATLYKLLSGQAPFANEKTNSPVKKLMAVVSKTPEPLTNYRNDIPNDLLQLTDSMLAKQPQQRPATPNELVKAVEPFTNGFDLRPLLDGVQNTEAPPSLTPTSSIAAFDASTLGQLVTTPDSAREELDATTVLPAPTAQPTEVTPPEITPGSPEVQPAPADSSDRIKSPITKVLIATGMAGFLLLLAGIVFNLPTKDGGSVRFEINDPSIKVSFGKDIVTIDDSGKEYEIKPGNHRLEIVHGDMTFTGYDFKLGSDEDTRIRLSYINNEMVVDHNDRKHRLDSLVPAEDPVQTPVMTDKPNENSKPIIKLTSKSPRHDVARGWRNGRRQIVGRRDRRGGAEALGIERTIHQHPVQPQRKAVVHACKKRKAEHLGLSPLDA